MAKEIGEKPYAPFLMVLFFGLLGYFAYYLHYKQKLKYNKLKGGKN